jgi:hypothetical protein
MDFEDIYRYNTFAARATLHPDKSDEEVLEIIEKNLAGMRLDTVYDIDTGYRENQDRLLIKKQVDSMANSQFRKELENLVNRYSKENGSDTPDFILATYLDNALQNFDTAVRAREKWHGRAEQEFATQQEIPFSTISDAPPEEDVV